MNITESIRSTISIILNKCIPTSRIPELEANILLKIGVSVASIFCDYDPSKVDNALNSSAASSEEDNNK